MTCTTTKIPEKIQRTWSCDFCKRDVVTVDKLHRPPGWYAIHRLPFSTHRGGQHMCPECGTKRLARP